MAAIVALFTIVDYFLRKVPGGKNILPIGLSIYHNFLDLSDELPAIVKIFSARANSRALFQVTETKSNPNVIECIHGIRCMTLFWVIFSHEYVDSLITANLNLVDWFLVSDYLYILSRPKRLFFFSGLRNLTPVLCCTAFSQWTHFL